ncbi:MAG: PAS domain S-box protein [Bacillota bacterium]
MENQGNRGISIIPDRENLRQLLKASESHPGIEALYAMHSEWQSMMQILQTMFDLTGDPIAIIDPHFKILAANKACHQKYARNEGIIGSYCYEVTHNNSEPCSSPHDCPLVQTLRTGTNESAKHTHYGSNGEEVFVEVSTAPIRNKQGDIIHVIHTTRDITDQVMAEETLKQIKVQHQRVVEILPLSTIIHLQGNILFANVAAAKMLGAESPDELQGKEIMGFFHPDVVAALEERFQWALGGEQVPSTEAKLIRLDGKIIDFEFATTSLTYHGKQVLLLAGSDITERKKAELDRLEANNRMARMEKLASLGTMAAGIAHEVVQPLNALKVTVDGMLYWFNRGQSLDVARVSENLKKVSAQADRINEIIKHVQSLIHTQQGNHHLHQP